MISGHLAMLSAQEFATCSGLLNVYICFTHFSCGNSFVFSAMGHSNLLLLDLVRCNSCRALWCRLEQESAFYFNIKYFEEKVHAGEWDEVERYLSGFTKVDDNRYSMKIFFEIRKQKYLEALDRYYSCVSDGKLHSILQMFGVFPFHVLALGGNKFTNFL